VKNNSKGGSSAPGDKSKALAFGDFKLDSWTGPAKSYRFIGWRDDHSALFLLDDQGVSWVVEPILLRPQNPIHYPKPPEAITKIRLLPPPCRATLAEAKLLAEISKLPGYLRCHGLNDVLELYSREARERGGDCQTPQQWELIYGEALSLESAIKAATGAGPKKSLPPAGPGLSAIQDRCYAEWAKKHGLTLLAMEDGRAQLVRHHGAAADHTAQLVYFAKVCYKLDISGFLPIWLAGFNGPQKPLSTADLDQVAKLLAARPEIVHLTPDAMAALLNLKPDGKYRTLRKYCQALKLDLNALTPVDLPRLRVVQQGLKEAQAQGALTANKIRYKKF